VARTRYTPRPAPITASLPFDNAEQAWFWYVRCQRLRQEGVRFIDGSTQLSRPCDPDDLPRTVLQLRRRGRISNRHVSVLNTYGFRECPPDHRRRDEERAARLWDEALDLMTAVLQEKGIVL